MDIIHSFSNWLDHNRDRAIGWVLATAILAVPACGLLEGKSIDPTTGQVATADVIYANVTSKVDVLTEQITTLTSQRDTLVNRGNEAIDDANQRTDDNYAFAADVINHPMVAPWLASFGLGGLALGFFERRNSKRKDKVITKLKA